WEGGAAVRPGRGARGPRAGRDGPLEPLGRTRSETGGVVAAQHDADREPLAKRDAPAPAGIETPDQHLAGLVVPGEVLEVGEVRDVLARPKVGADAERARAEASAAG